VLALPASLLRRYLGQLRADNAQGEYYLTDVIGMAVEDGHGGMVLLGGGEGACTPPQSACEPTVISTSQGRINLRGKLIHAISPPDLAR
jgi:bifunctional UDP-N-acetylglucosamine pyrophosphorylase/glucosamine-1-phosphate N-acetyltransferase